jgi:hypothetical protein
MVRASRPPPFPSPRTLPPQPLNQPTASNQTRPPQHSTRFVAWVLTISGAYRNASPDLQAACSTNTSRAIADSPWFRFPYPGQWGPPILDAYSTLTMLAGALPAMLESLGDYYACSQIAGAPIPPPDVLSRAVAWQVRPAACAACGARAYVCVCVCVRVCVCRGWRGVEANGGSTHASTYTRTANPPANSTGAPTDTRA